MGNGHFGSLEEVGLPQKYHSNRTGCPSGVTALILGWATVLTKGIYTVFCFRDDLNGVSPDRDCPRRLPE